jgi:hypothetical protein
MDKVYLTVGSIGAYISIMDALTTRYLELHEAINHEELRATLRESYQTRPGEEDREDSLEHGTVSTDIAGVIKSHDDVLDQFEQDRVINLSLVSDDAQEELLETFTPLDDSFNLVRQWIKLGVNPAAAVDYYYVNVEGLTQKDWAEERGVTPQAVHHNISLAEEGFTSGTQSMVDGPEV